MAALSEEQAREGGHQFPLGLGPALTLGTALAALVPKTSAVEARVAHRQVRARLTGAHWLRRSA